MIDVNWALLFLLSSWSVRLIMLPIIVSRKDRPATCLAWLAIVFFQPWIGLLFYLMLGQRRLVRKKLRWRAAASRRFYAKRPVLGDEKPRTRTRQVLVSMANLVGGLPVVEGNAMELLSDTDETMDRLVADLDAAQHHAHLEFYIFRSDSMGQRVADALIRARKRGVECRLAADAVGSRRMFRRIGRRLQAEGVEVVECLPISLFRRGFVRNDLRNHRKLVVIDGATAWAGSQNVVDASYGKGRLEWRDIMARITGPIVRQFQVTFCEDWFHETEERLLDAVYYPLSESTGTASMQVVPSGPDQATESFQHLVVQAIQSARREVRITSPYFVPDEPLLLALRMAAKRGVEVKLILPERTDHPIVDAVRGYYCPLLSADGVQVYFFNDGLLHAKTLTVDETFGMFGSANYDIRSFHLNFELNVTLYDSASIAELREVQEQYRRPSRLVSTEEWAARSRLRRFGTDVAKLFSPLL